MASSAVLILAALLGSCSTFTDAVGVAVRQNEFSSEESETYMSIFCSPLPDRVSPTSSVHALRPDDVAAVYTLGMPLSKRNEAPRIVSRLAELLSMFSPEVITQHVDQTSVQPRSLLEEAEELSLSLSHEVTDWKLVLLFAPTDSMCACSPNVAADVQAVVQEVEAALEILQKRLHRTLVHVVTWSEYHQDKCECMKNKNINRGLYKATLLKTLQDSLSHVLDNPKWHSEGVDFTVVLQPEPVILEPKSDSEHPLSDLDQLANQIWTNLLQPSQGQAEVMEASVFLFPCPTQERPFLRTQINSPTEKEVPVATDPIMGTEMPCTDRSPSPTTPTSVHELRPGDIKVVAAVGDSLTAANGVGAKVDNLLLVINQYRGLSWSIGGDENITTVTTLPNILKEFNPSVTGFSTEICSQDQPASFLNQAVPGAKSGNMVEQVRVLVDKMKTDSRIDFQNDWKVITMFIGGNDICDYCTDSVRLSARNVAVRIQEALDILHKEVPRAMVNLVEMLNILPLRDVHSDKTLGCPTWFVNLVCPCVLKPKDGSVELQQAERVSRAYQLAMRQLVDSGRYETHDNFTVVLQPFFREVFLPYTEDGRPDRTYFSPDCFHLSQKAHTLMARALWNNMLEPVGNKTFEQDFTEGIELKCPSEANPYFRTSVNSGYTFPGPPPTPPSVTNWGSDFFCTNTAPSNSVPTSAHRVRPADIKVVGAVGDSLTAAFGARAETLLQLRTEYRGVSWSIGGDDSLETVTTLPNILKKFNPTIKGMSKGTGKNETGFNMAISGAKIAGIPGQIRTLIDTMKNESTVDFQNDWKLVTIFIGGNDLCQYCNDRATFSPQNFSNHMMASLDLLYQEVPRVIVNVLEILEIEGLRRIKRDSLGCNVLQPFICSCFLLPGEDSPELAEIKWFNREIQVRTERLVYSGRYDGREDFAAVVQPFFRNTIVPVTADGYPDDSYFSEDCFHFSERGQAEMAINLWNNMLEPVGEKQSYNVFTNARDRIKCPTEEHPYIFTRVNSLPESTTARPSTATSTARPSTTTSTTRPSTTTSTTRPSTTTSTTRPSTTTSAKPLPPDCSNTVPVWLAAVLAVVGLLIGCAATWLLLFYIAKRKSKKTKLATVEMKGTGF